jgi:hypothetical protein
MSIINQLNFNSYSEIASFLSGRLEDRIKIAGILQRKHCILPEVKEWFTLTQEFQQVISRGSGLDVIAASEKYEELRIRTISTLKEAIFPKLFDALKCHQIAMQKYQMGTKEEAVQEMAKTNQLALEIENEFKALGNDFLEFRGVLANLFLKGAPLGEAQVKALNAYLFFNLVNQVRSYSDSELGDLEMLPIIEDEGPNDFINLLEKMFLGLTPSEVFPDNSVQVQNVMRTGRNPTVPSETSSFAKVIASYPSGLVNRFVDSAYNWLALAEAAYTVKTAMEADSPYPSQSEINFTRRDLL